MKLLFKQRFFSWFDSYDIYDENGDTIYAVKGQLSWGHCLKIFDDEDIIKGTVKEKILTFLPRFEIYDEDDILLGSIRKEFTFFKPKYNIDFNGWSIEGSIMEWDYMIYDEYHQLVATVSKQLFRWTDTYVLDIVDENDALYVLMFVLAIDAEKCSRSKNI